MKPHGLARSIVKRVYFLKGGICIAVLQVHDINDQLYGALKQKAGVNNKTINQEVIAMLETYLSSSDMSTIEATREFLTLSCDDNRNADEIIDELRMAVVERS
jgi:hypothetical protein